MNRNEAVLSRTELVQEREEVVQRIAVITQPLALGLGNDRRLSRMLVGTTKP